jgi:CheY-like chemotaxis protein
MMNRRDSQSILIVEDDPETREVLSAILRFEGYKVLTAADGQQALDVLQGRELPSMILLDLMMPNKDGWQFRAEQSQDPRIADIPVIVFSAADRLKERAGSLRAVAYLKKPVDFDALLALVDRHSKDVKELFEPESWH